MGATTTLRKQTCPECNAPLTVDENLDKIKCSYCGHTFVVGRKRPDPQAGTPQPQPQKIVVQAPPSRPSWLRVLPILPFSIIALVVYLMQKPGAVSSTVSKLTGGIVSDVSWDAVAPGPILADVDGDGFEDLIGRGRKIDPDELWVVAFGGSDLRARWRVGPLGDWNAHQTIRFAVAGQRVLVTDARHTARVVDLKTGASLANIALPDNASDVCGDPAGARFFVATVDGGQQFVGGDPPARSEGKRPAWCPKSGAMGLGMRSAGMRHRFAFAEPGGEREVRAPHVPGMRVAYTVSDGARAVAIGEKQPGTTLPMAAGFAVGAHAIDWSRVLPSIDPAGVKGGAVDVAALRDGTLYAYYELTSLRGGRVIAVDAASGTTRWDVILPDATGSAPEEIVVGRDRVYVPHWTRLDVFDKKSGAVVGTIGR